MTAHRQMPGRGHVVERITTGFLSCEEARQQIDVRQMQLFEEPGEDMVGPPPLFFTGEVFVDLVLVRDDKDGGVELMDLTQVAECLHGEPRVLDNFETVERL